MPMTSQTPSGGKAIPSLNGTSTPSGLAERTLKALRVTFEGFGQELTPAMWDGLADVARTLERMAAGRCDPAVYVSSLDPGVGKTQLLVHFLRELVQSPDHSGVGAIICVQRKEQIRSIALEAGIDRFAVLTSDDELNMLATAELNEAQVLFSTHKMIETRCSRVGSFGGVAAFHFKGHVRTVRLWDETILPGQPLTVTLDELRALPVDLRRWHPEFTNSLDEVNRQIESAEDGQQIALLDLPSIHEVAERDARKIVTGRASDVVDRLWPLFGRSVTVRRGWGISILDFRDSLPRDLKPLVVLDASARLRTTYDLWSAHRGGLVRLNEAPKDYGGLTIGVWDRGGGKDAFTYDAPTIAEGVAKTIAERLDEEWLVIHHKPSTEFDFQKLVLSRLSAEHISVHFLTWGRHDATNEFAHVPNVILAGTLFKPVSYYEAVGRLAANLPSSSGEFVLTKEVTRGEYAHDILQALGRSAVRRLHDGSCPATRAFIVARKASGIAGLLPEAFPGSTVTAWQPIPKQLMGQQEAAFEFIMDRIEANPSEVVRFTEVVDHLGIDPKNFKNTRKHAAFRLALAARGVEEWEDEVDGQFRGFWHPYRYRFGDDYE
jgi:hypothetical protein